MPQNEHEWLQIAREFEIKWQFPHCLGAIDGKHIKIQSPINIGSEFYNYKHNFSIILLAVADSDYNFLFADVGTHGRMSDGGFLMIACFITKYMDLIPFFRKTLLYLIDIFLCPMYLWQMELLHYLKGS